MGEPRSAGMIQIAVIDEYPVLRSGIPSWLAEADPAIEVVVAVASLDQFIRSGPLPADAVVLDVDPAFGAVGVQVAWLVAIGYRVVVFGHCGPWGVREAMRAGAAACVPKTAEAGALVAAIRSAVAAGPAATAREPGTASESGHPPVLDTVPGRAACDALPRTGPDLSPRELEVVRLYVTGLKLDAVARRIGVTANTAKQYLGRAKAKYEAVGRRTSTRLDLYRRATEDGIVGSPSIR